jgi:hypothetical protein
MLSRVAAAHGGYMADGRDGGNMENEEDDGFLDVE